MTLQPYQSPLDQAWLRLWVGLHGPSSRLAGYLSNEATDEHWARPAARPGSGSVDDQAGEQSRRHPRPPRLEGREARRDRSPPVEKDKARRPRPAVARPKSSPGERAERRLRKDVDRFTRLPTSDWAKSLVNDPRIAEVKLQDVLDGIEDYFELFDEMRRVNVDAHAYFSRVGAPIITRGTSAWTSQIAAARIANPKELPSYFGAFFTKTKAQDREDTINDSPCFSEFYLFEKPKNHATVAPLDTTIFTHNSIRLKRDCNWTKREKKEYPWVTKNWGYWFYIGILPDGSVRALPHRFSRYQKLPGGDGVQHSSFEIPPALYEMHNKLDDPHTVARLHFNCAFAFAAASLGGITVSIKKGKQAARFGLPVTALKDFFVDRDAGGERKKQIMHLRLGHDRTLADGRVVLVGEHLRGERFFTWRGYEVSIGVPGIHFPSPEGNNNALWVVGDPDAPLPAYVDRSKLISMKETGKRVRDVIWEPRRVPFRRGEPTERFHRSALPQHDEHDMTKADRRLLDLFDDLPFVDPDDGDGPFIIEEAKK